LRVLYLNPFSQEVSGPDESLLTVLAELIPMGIEAHVVLPRPGPQVPRYEKLGAKIHYAPLTVLRRRMGAATALLPLQLLRGVAAVASIVRRERIALIHTNMEVVLEGSVVSRLLRLPHVLHYRGNTNDEPRLVFDALTRFWTATAEKVFCISEATAEIFRARGRGEKVEVLYNGVALERFAAASRSDEVRAELGAEPTDVLVGAVGRIHPRKDLATFLRAGALATTRIPRLRLAVIGAAEVPEEVAYEAAMKALASSLGIEDRLVWAGPRRDVPRVMCSLDALVASSRNEGFGRVVAEAMASGLRTVATREGAFVELVRGWRGARTAAPASPGEFASALVDVLSIAPETPASVARFGARAVAARVRDCYGRLAANLAVPTAG
jgi:glycosyltransferase involved in cell wall biosynthesis